MCFLEKKPFVQTGRGSCHLPTLTNEVSWESPGSLGISAGIYRLKQNVLNRAGAWIGRVSGGYDGFLCDVVFSPRPGCSWFGKRSSVIHARKLTHLEKSTVVCSAGEAELRASILRKCEIMNSPDLKSVWTLLFDLLKKKKKLSIKNNLMILQDILLMML